MQMDPTIIFTALTAAIGALAGWIAVATKNQNAKHEKCEADKDALEVRINKLEMDQAVFQTCDKTPCGAREAFQRRASFSVSGNQKP